MIIHKHNSVYYMEYATMQSDMVDHYLIKPYAQCHGVYEVGGFKMFDCVTFPYVVRDEHDVISFELFEFNKEHWNDIALPVIKQLWHVPLLAILEEVAIECVIGGRTTILSPMMVVGNPDLLGKHMIPVKNGTWNFDLEIV